MKKVKVEGHSLAVHSGTVELTAEQAGVRRHALKVVRETSDGGVYEVIAPVQFKKGEVLGFDGEVGKNGVAFDPEAGRRAEQAQLDRTEARIREDVEREYRGKFEKALAKEREATQKQIDDQLESARTSIEAKVLEELTPKLRAELETSVRAELTPKIRAELEAELAAAAKSAKK